MSLILLGIYSDGELLGPMVTSCQPFEELLDCSAQQLHHFTFSLATWEGSDLSTALPMLVHLFEDSHSSGRLVFSRATVLPAYKKTCILFMNFFCHTHGIWKFPWGQGLNLSHSSDVSHSSDHAGSFDHWGPGENSKVCILENLNPLFQSPYPLSPSFLPTLASRELDNSFGRRRASRASAVNLDEPRHYLLRLFHKQDASLGGGTHIHSFKALGRDEVAIVTQW